jgi:phospholipid/cholesterol/gamma-HCH transport system permease protein
MEKTSSQAREMEWLDHLGRPFVRLVEYIVELFFMCYLSLRSISDQSRKGLRAFLNVTAQQIYFTGWQGLPIITFLALVTGLIVVMQSATSFTRFGGWSLLGQILVSSVVRELGPVLTAVVVIARSGTAVATEIGNMKVNRELEALESMAIQPLYFVVLPRLLGGMVSTVSLVIFFVFVTLMSGYFIAHWTSDYSFEVFLRAIASALNFSDVIILFVKALVSGFLIFAVSCYQGLKVTENPLEVPQATTKAVVHSLIFVMSFNASITLAFFLSEFQRLGVL